MNPQQREQLRKACLSLLARRQAFDLDVSQITFHLIEQKRLLFAFTEESVAECLAFLVGMGLVEEKRGELGASLTYKATSQGVLLYERNFAT